MKKIVGYALVTLCITLTVALIVNPVTSIGSARPLHSAPGSELPDSIQNFVQKACMDCHADGKNAMARGKLNFSTWAGYDDAKQAKKAGAMYKELSKSSMPPKKWRENKPDNIPTPEEVSMVLRWAKSLQK